jgi:hypothetical protein
MLQYTLSCAKGAGSAGLADLPPVPVLSRRHGGFGRNPRQRTAARSDAAGLLCAEKPGPRAEDDCELVVAMVRGALSTMLAASERILHEVCQDRAIQPVSAVGPDEARWRRLIAKFAVKKLAAEGLVFSLKAGNKPAETADDPAAPGPYDGNYKNNQGDNR